MTSDLQRNVLDLVLTTCSHAIAPCHMHRVIASYSHVPCDQDGLTIHMSLGPNSGRVGQGTQRGEPIDRYLLEQSPPFGSAASARQRKRRVSESDVSVKAALLPTQGHRAHGVCRHELLGDGLT